MRSIVFDPALALAVALAAAAPASAQGPAETLPYDAAHPAAGLWIGEIAEGGRGGFAVIAIEHDGNAWSGKATAMHVMAIDQPLELRVEGRDVAFTLGSGAAALAVEARVSEDGQRLAATGSSPRGGRSTFELRRTIRPSQTAEPIALAGKVELPGGGQTLDLNLAFGRTAGGTWVGEIAIPAQGLRAFPLVNVQRLGDAITATLPGPPDAVIEASFSEHDGRLTGSLKQAGFEMPLELSRSGEVAIKGPRRPQAPEPPFPYRVEPFTVACTGGWTLAGTLTLPAGPGPHPAVVLVSGSGQQDRDETIFDHKPFHVIADHLSRHGVAVARYDDRGVGESTGIETVLSATSRDFADDAAAVVRWLRGVEGIDRGRVGLLGHSEGGIIAPMVANDDPRVAFVVLLAGTAVPGREILLLQTRLLQEAAGADAEALEEMGRRQAEALDLVIDGAEDERIRRAIVELSRSQLALHGQALPEGEVFDAAVEAELRRVTSPWMKFFLTYDPVPALERLRCPVLALNGELDLQVDADQNLAVVASAIRRGGGEVTAKRYPGVNHLFQPAETGAVTEYARIETTVDPQALDDIVTWMAARNLAK